MLARAQIAPRGEGSLLSVQRPGGPMWRRFSRAGVLLRSCVAALCLAGVYAAAAQQPYRLLGQAAPDFALRAVAGGNVRVSEHRGEVVVLSFWSSRCTPCRTQLASLNRSFATYRSAGLVMYGVGVDDDPNQALAFARSAAVGFPMLLDPEKGVARNYEVDNLPMTVLIDRGGNVRYVLRDYSAANETVYLQELRALLNE
jgi:peroxiredoxin